MKKPYEAPKMELIPVADVIATSEQILPGGNGGNGAGGGATHG